MFRAVTLSTLLLTACGGSGGGGTGVSPPARLSIGDLEFAPGATTADLVISLADLSTPAPALMQIAIDLPPALTIAPVDPLQPIQAVPTLRGARTSGRYVVVCGDDRNRQGAPLSNGELFRLRLVTTVPRQVGTHSILLRDLIVAQSDGTPAPSDANPTTVTAIVN